MTLVTLSQKFHVVIPKDVRNSLNLVPGQTMQIREVGGRIEAVPELPMLVPDMTKPKGPKTHDTPSV